MASQGELLAFTVVPGLVLGAAIVYSAASIRDLDDRRPLLLVLLLAMMAVHQATELVMFTAGAPAWNAGPIPEGFESGANLLASAAAYVVVNLLSDERDRLEELAEKRHELAEFRQAVEDAGLAIYITDEEGGIRYVNPAFEDVTGYREAEVVGRTPDALYSTAHGDGVRPDIVETVRAGEVRQDEAVKQRRSGELFIADQTITPIVDETGAAQGAVGIFQDITERTQKEQYLAVLERVIRHNLRNELNVIAGTAQDVQDAHVPQGETAAADDIVGACEDLLELVGHASDISRLLESGRSERPLTELLADLRAYCRRTHPGATVTVGGDPPAVTVDGRLYPALVELCDNAVKHGSAPAHIDVGAAHRAGEEGFVEVSVADDGPGIPEQERAVLRDGRETPLKHGSGLGLWLVYLAATTAGGTVGVDENDPRGSVVTLSVPRLD